MKILLLFGCLLLAPSFVRAQTVVINEFMSSNTSVIADEDGDFSDWIELYNTSNTTVPLQGYGLTDDPQIPFKWTFPDTELPAGGHLLIYASDKNRAVTGANLHTNFKISASGEPLQLRDTEGNIIDQTSAIKLANNESYGRQPDGSSTWTHYLTHPTPGMTNAASTGVDVLSAPLFSKKGGFYTNALALTLQASEAGATVRYTLDGSEPTETSTLYSGPISIQSRAGEPNVLSIIPTNQVTAGPSTYYPPQSEIFKATVVRAKVFKTGATASETVTQTYFVDPQINERYPLPVISISTNQAGWFGGKKGIYVPGDDFNGDNDRSGNYYQRGEAWERPANLEFFDTDRSKGFSQQVGVRIHGSASRVDPQKSLRIYADKKYGKSTIQYPLFPNKPIAEYKRFLLRNAGNDRSYSMVRDAFIQNLVAGEDIDVQANRPVIVFLNGEYWGIHHLQERIDKHYIAENHGVDADNIDFLEMDQVPVEGDATHYEAMLNYFKSHDIRESPSFDTIAKRMDVDEFITYQAAQLYAANVDWPGNNLDYWRPRTANGKWRWIFYDLDFGFGLAANSGFDRNMLPYATDPNGPLFGTPAASNVPHGTFLLRTLLQNERFKNRFINRFADLLNTTFKTEPVLAKLSQLKASLQPVMAEHIARWRAPSSLSQWESHLEVLQTFAQQRPTYQRQHLVDFFGLENTAAITLQVSDPQKGRIQINSLVIDEQTPGANPVPYPWQGIYFQHVPIQLTALPKPGYVFVGWSDASLPQQPSIELTPTGDLSLTALFDVQDASPTLSMPQPFALSGGNFSFTDWSASQPATRYPANIGFYRAAVSHPGLSEEPTANYREAYNLTAGTRINGLDTDGFSFVNANTEGNLCATVLALNSSGRTNLHLQWVNETVAANELAYTVRLQYKVGNSDWLDVLQSSEAVEYRSQNTDRHHQAFSIPLSNLTGNSVDNQPLVYLRWKYYPQTAGTGIGAQIRMGDISVTSEAVAALPVRLAISSVNNRYSPSRNAPFPLIIQALDAAGNPQTVTTDTDFTITLSQGTGILGGTLSGQIPAGQKSVQLPSLIYDHAETGIQLTVNPAKSVPLQASVSMPFDVLETASKLVFVNNYPYGAAGTRYRPFTIAAKRPDNSLDINWNGNVTITLASGTGSLSGTFTQTFQNGLADFTDIVFNQGGEYTLSAVAPSLSPIVTTPIKIAGFTEVMIPQVIQGHKDINTQRVPYVFRATLHHLNASAIYRYFSQVVSPEDSININGAGNAIFSDEKGFTRTTDVSLDKAGQYGQFTTDATGSYTGWFIIEPTGNKRFTPGNQLKLRLILNDGGGNDSPFFRLTGNNFIQVIDFGNASSSGSALVGTSCATEGNVIAFFDNTGGEGRPVSATLTENDQVANSIANGYAPFYATQVDGQRGTWGAIIPNLLPNGIRRIEQEVLHSGITAGYATSNDGKWKNVSTVNPVNGLSPMILSMDAARLAIRPTITQSGQELVASEANEYQWYINDTVISGATQARFTPVQNGLYKVLTNGSTCDTNFSLPYSFVLTDTSGPELATLVKVYPNPTDGRVSVTFNCFPSEHVELRLFNLVGQEIMYQSLQSLTGEYAHTLNLSGYHTGLYLLQIRCGNNQFTQKIILHR